MPPAPLPLSGRSLRTTDSPISYFIRKAIETPGLISLAAGLVDADSLPAADVGAAVAALMADPAAAKAALQYGSTQGLPALREKVQAEYDAGGAIGRRYRRQDEIGTPHCITIDFDTLGEGGEEKKNTVTLRDRDTGEQERVKISELLSRLR